MANKLLFLLSIPFRILFTICLAIIQILFRRLNGDPDLINRKIASDLFQHTISAIESYKIEFNTYPESFSDPEIIKLMKGFYVSAFHLFSYKKHEIGYEINVLDEDYLELKLPDDFWIGLGICKTNVPNFSKGETEESNQN